MKIHASGAERIYIAKLSADEMRREERGRWAVQHAAPEFNLVIQKLGTGGVKMNQTLKNSAL